MTSRQERKGQAVRNFADDAMRAADQGLRQLDATSVTDLDKLLKTFEHADSPKPKRSEVPTSPSMAQKKELLELEAFLDKQNATLDRLSALPVQTPKTAAAHENIDVLLEQVMKMEEAEKKVTSKKSGPAGRAYLSDNRKPLRTSRKSHSNSIYSSTSTSRQNTVSKKNNKKKR